MEVAKSVARSLFQEQNILKLAQGLKSNFQAMFFTRDKRKGSASIDEKMVFIPHPFQLPHILKIMYKRHSLNTLAQFLDGEEGQSLFYGTLKVRLSKFQRKYEDFCVANMSMYFALL
jgi:hypothetical protein